MCQVQLVKNIDDKKKNKKDIDTVNSKVIDSTVKDAGKIVSSVPVINEEVVEAYKPKRGRKKKLVDASELDFYLKDDKGKNVTVKLQVSSGAVDIPKDAYDRDVIRAVAIMTGLSERQAADVLDAMESIITKEIKKGNEVKITNFGTFYLSKREAREGRNPQTGQVVKLKAYKAPKFKPAKALEEKVESIIVFKFLFQL
jgi:DNA-binding protein HU-beta